jgi:hypothetical protein
MDKRLIELVAAWPGLTGGRARMADALRLFVITWDPLAGMVHRPSGFATTNGAGADLEIVVYLPTWSLVRTATARNSTVKGVMAALAGSAIATASRYENAVNAGRYPDLAARDEVPDLLSDPAAGSALGAADITALSNSGRRAGWEPMGLGAITDLVQHAFGPVDLDRSPVELAAVATTHPGCPACAGGRFGFPGDLAESRASMCPTHRRQADSVISRRLARANASNPDGWAAISAASQAINQPHLPNGLASRLPHAASSLYVIPGPDELADRAAALVEAAGWFRGRPDEFALALGQEPELAGLWPEWLENLVLNLGAAGMGVAAERVGDALGKVHPGGQASFDADVAVALAESGLADEARDRNRGKPGPLAARSVGPHARRRRPRRAGRSRGSIGAFRGRAADGRGKRRLRSQVRGDPADQAGHPAVRRRAQRTRPSARATQAQAQQGTAPTPRAPQASVARSVCVSMAAGARRNRRPSVKGTG